MNVVWNLGCLIYPIYCSWVFNALSIAIEYLLNTLSICSDGTPYSYSAGTTQEQESRSQSQRNAKESQRIGTRLTLNSFFWMKFFGVNRMPPNYSLVTRSSGVSHAVHCSNNNILHSSCRSNLGVTPHLFCMSIHSLITLSRNKCTSITCGKETPACVSTRNLTPTDSQIPSKKYDIRVWWRFFFLLSFSFSFSSSLSSHPPSFYVVF